MTLLRRSNLLDRTQIALAFEPFAQPAATRGMVVGNDLDSLLSACFLKSLFGWDVAAIYDYRSLWIPADEPNFVARFLQGEYAAIDLDIYHPQIFSLGHHVLERDAGDVLAGHARTLNPNFIRGVNVSNFAAKYPLGTIHFLVWLFNQTDLTRPAKFLMWLADSAFINAQSHRFRENALDWARSFFRSEFFAAMTERVDLPGFEEALQKEILPALQENPLANFTGQVHSRHLRLGGFQCQWEDPNRQRDSILALLDTLAALTGWDAPRLPARFVQTEGKRRSASVKEILRRFGGLDHFLMQEGVFSYVFPYRDAVNYTTGIIEALKR